MRTILIDDENHCNNVLSELIKAYCPQLTIIGICTSVTEGVQCIEKEKPDLVFLDVELGEQSGMQLLMQLQPLNFEVVFVTAHDQYALEAIRLSALDYILKPPTSDALMAAVVKASQRTHERKLLEHYQFFFDTMKRRDANQTPQRIALPNHHHIIEYVHFQQIIYIEADKQYSVFHLTDHRKIVVAKGLNEYEQLLNKHGFLRVHRSYVVNEEHIKRYLKSDEQLELYNGVKIPVARGLKNDVLKILSL
jgi:two-component system, LytTR family, response regulator